MRPLRGSMKLIIFYYVYFYNIATLTMRPFSNLSLFSHAKESIREAKPLLYKFPLPLVKGKGIKGIGFLKLMG